MLTLARTAGVPLLILILFTTGASTPQTEQIGRYQLVAGSVEFITAKERGTLAAIVRIDTATGKAHLLMGGGTNNATANFVWVPVLERDAIR